MADQATRVNGGPKVAIDSPLTAGVFGNLAEFASDVTTLGELQTKLAMHDLKESAGKLVIPSVGLIVSGVLALAALPVVLLGIGEILVEYTTLSRGFSYLIVAAGTLVLAVHSDPDFPSPDRPGLHQLRSVEGRTHPEPRLDQDRPRPQRSSPGPSSAKAVRNDLMTLGWSDAKPVYQGFDCAPSHPTNEGRVHLPRRTAPYVTNLEGELQVQGCSTTSVTTSPISVSVV